MFSKLVLTYVSLGEVGDKFSLKQVVALPHCHLFLTNNNSPNTEPDFTISDMIIACGSGIVYNIDNVSS